MPPEFCTWNSTPLDFSKITVIIIIIIITMIRMNDDSCNIISN